MIFGKKRLALINNGSIRQARIQPGIDSHMMEYLYLKSTTKEHIQYRMYIELQRD